MNPARNFDPRAKPAIKPPAMVWWVIWAAITSGFVQIYLMLGKTANSDGVMWWVSVPPLLVGLGLRYGLVPRWLGKPAAFPVFVIALALVEGSGMMGIFLGGQMKLYVAAAAFVGLLACAPLFLLRREE